MIVKLIITCVCALPVFYLAMRYNLHMLQLNEYHNSEQFHWLKKNLRRQWLLYVGIIYGVLQIIFNSTIITILAAIDMLLAIATFNALRRGKNKKKLVFTARIKRLIWSDILVSLIVVILFTIFGGLKRTEGAVLLVSALQFLTVIFANFINIPVEKAVKQYYINDARKILKKHDGLTVIGVTGSYGKTSVKFYIETLLKEKYNVLVTPESYNTPMGVVMTIRGMLKPTHQIFVCEMGANRVGDIKRICKIVDPDHAVITSIGPQHLETFYNMENITKTKFELADSVPKGGHIILNGDNEYIHEHAKNYDNVTFYFSKENSEGYYAKDVKATTNGTEFTVVAPNGETGEFSTRLVGIHNVINVMSAITVAHTFGISLKDLKIAVRRISPVPHRMQMIPKGDITIIDDAFNSNPIGSKAAVETLAMFEGTRILITPGMVDLGEKEEEYNYKFGTYAAKCCDYIFLIGIKRTEPIKKGILSEGFDETKLKSFNKLEEAMAVAQSLKSEGHKYILLENDLPDNY